MRYSKNSDVLFLQAVPEQYVQEQLALEPKAEPTVKPTGHIMVRAR